MNLKHSHITWGSFIGRVVPLAIGHGYGLVSQILWFIACYDGYRDEYNLDITPYCLSRQKLQCDFLWSKDWT